MGDGDLDEVIFHCDLQKCWHTRLLPH